MNREIEEMVKVMCCDRQNFKSCKSCKSANQNTKAYCRIEHYAELLYKNGYRKSTDVAREIDDLKRYIILNENIAKKCKEENGEQNEEYWKGKLAAFLQIRGYIDTELRKKYESEEEE